MYRGSSTFLNGTASATDTNNASVIAAQGSGVKIHVSFLVISNSSATNAEVLIKDGTTTKLTIPAPATGGAVCHLDPPLVLSDNAALNFASGTSVTTMKVSAIGYKGE